MSSQHGHAVGMADMCFMTKKHKYIWIKGKSLQKIDSMLESPVLPLPVLFPVDQDAVLPATPIATLVLKRLVFLEIFQLDNLHIEYKDSQNNPMNCCVHL